ncbi:MAG: hypothetical protein KAG10_09720 [Methylococcales bacterium]|nr:hypothetical protein [Methylococcales bacterium]
MIDFNNVMGFVPFRYRSLRSTHPTKSPILRVNPFIIGNEKAWEQHAFIVEI